MEEIRNISIKVGLSDYISKYGIDDISTIYHKDGKWYEFINKINSIEILVIDSTGRHSVILISNEYVISDNFVRFCDLPKEIYTQQELPFKK